MIISDDNHHSDGNGNINKTQQLITHNSKKSAGSNAQNQSCTTTHRKRLLQLRPTEVARISRASGCRQLQPLASVSFHNTATDSLEQSSVSQQPVTKTVVNRKTAMTRLMLLGTVIP